MKNRKSISRVLLTALVIAVLCLSLISCNDLLNKITGNGNDTSDTGGSGNSGNNTGGSTEGDNNTAGGETNTDGEKPGNNAGESDDNKDNSSGENNGDNNNSGNTEDSTGDNNGDNTGGSDDNKDDDTDEEKPGEGEDDNTPTPSPTVITVGNVMNDFIYNGQPQTPDVSVTYGDVRLVKNVDYKTTYLNNINAGEASLTVRFIGRYEGESSVTRSFTILPKDASGATVTVEDILEGETPVAEITLPGFALTDSDYTVTFGDYSEACESVNATVTFKGNFTGSIGTSFAVESINVLIPDIELACYSYVYSGAAYMPAARVSVSGNVLTKDIDYDIIYTDNVNAGTGTVTVTLKGIYSGSASANFTIEKLTVPMPTIPDSVFMEYDGTERTFPVTFSPEFCTADGLVNTNAGEYTAVVSLKNPSSMVWSNGTSTPISYEYSIAPANIGGSIIVIVEDTTVGVMPTVTITHPHYNLTPGVDYDIDFGGYNKPGNSQIAVTLKGNYTGIRITNYTVTGEDVYLESHFDFNYDLNDSTGNHTASMIGSDPDAAFTRADYSGAIHTVGGRKSIVKIQGINLGTNDFSFFISVRFDTEDITDGTNQGNAIIESGHHSQYNCDGTNKNNCPICNGSALSEYQFDCVSVALVKNEYGGSYPYRLRVQIGKEYMSYLLTAMDAYYLTQGEYIDIAVTVDRKYSVAGDTDVTRVVLYFDGKEAATKDFNLGIDQTLGSDAIYLGGNLEWTSGGGIKYRDKYIDTFRLYNKALTEDDIWSIPTDTGESSDEKDWYIDDIVTGTAAIKTYGTEYGTIENYLSLYFTVEGDTDGLETLSLAQDYGSSVVLHHYPDENLYNLILTGTAVDIVKGGWRIKVSSGNSVRDINIIYNEVTSITSNDLYLYSISFTSNSGNKYERFYFDILDQEGRSVTGLTVRCEPLGNGPTFGYDRNEGRWFIEITENQAENRIYNTTRGYVTASFYAETNESLYTSMNIYYKKPYAFSEPGWWPNNTDESSYVIIDKTLGTNTWTVGMLLDIPHINTGDTIDLFSTTGRDASKGITLSIKAKSEDMWSARLRIDGVTLWYESISLHYYEGHTLAIILEIDRTEYGKIVTRLYYNSIENHISSSTKYVNSTNTLDYDESSIDGYVPECQIVFGGMNTTLTPVDGGTISSPDKCKSYDICFHRIIVVESLGHEAVNEYL